MKALSAKVCSHLGIFCKHASCIQQQDPAGVVEQKHQNWSPFKSDHSSFRCRNRDLRQLQIHLSLAHGSGGSPQSLQPNLPSLPLARPADEAVVKDASRPSVTRGQSVTDKRVL